jgi:Family of unknown function (DUF5318)
VGFRPGFAADEERVGSGGVDYRLQRQRLLSEVLAGRVGRADVCDAHPELLRVARNMVAPTAETCPVCEDAATARVSSVFGPRLPAGGKLCTTPAEVSRYRRRAGSFHCYEVEVCPACGWNHLLRRYPL